MAAAIPRVLPNGISFREWTVTSEKGHMLESRCHTTEHCKLAGEDSIASLCNYCRYTSRFSMPLPEETYALNKLVIAHPATGCKLEFSAFDALEGVDETKTTVEVACASEWAASRGATGLTTSIQPYDWTYTTDYAGSLSGGWNVSPTEEGIDMAALKVREKILFHDQLLLFTDDFSDNGAVILDVKVRVMPSSLFVLLREFVRVDKVLLRVHDSRFYSRFGSGYIIRESAVLEAPALKVERALGVASGDRSAVAALYQPDKIQAVLPHLKVIKVTNERLTPALADKASS